MITLEKKNKEKNDLRNEVREKAVNTFLKNPGKKGTIVLHTGMGKSWVFFDILYKLADRIRPHPVLFLAEETEREADIRKAGEDYKEVYGKNPLEDFDISFHCYQTAYKWKEKMFRFVCADEIHDSLSPEYAKFYKNNSMEYLLGLTATPKLEVEYEVTHPVTGKIKQFKKEDLYKLFAPILYFYGINQAIRNNTTRDIVLIKIPHSLDSKKFIKLPYSDTEVTEEQAYKLYENKMEYLRMINAHKKEKGKLGLEISNFLWTLPSKNKTIAKVLDTLEELDETAIVFGERVEELEKLNIPVLSSKISKEENNEILNSFEDEQFNIIGSVKKLKQGKNIRRDIDNIVVHSFTKQLGNLIQRIGRARYSEKKVYVLLLVTDDTKEIDQYIYDISNMINCKQYNASSLEDALKFYQKCLNEERNKQVN